MNLISTNQNVAGRIVEKNPYNNNKHSKKDSNKKQITHAHAHAHTHTHIHKEKKKFQIVPQ